MANTEETGESPWLVRKTLRELVVQGVTPSGVAFELMPDDAKTALAVGEIDESNQVKAKAVEAYLVTKSLGGEDIHAGHSGVALTMALHDVDVPFLGLAWTAAARGFKLKLPQPVPCPACSTPFKKLDLGSFSYMVRPPDQELPNGGFFEAFPEGSVDEDDVFEPSKLPGVSGKIVVIKAPGWEQARKRVPRSMWDRRIVVEMRRAMSCVYTCEKLGGSPTHLPPQLVETWPSAALGALMERMNDVFPHPANDMIIKCPSCGSESAIPFTSDLIRED
jgi:hypothetical protein